MLAIHVGQGIAMFGSIPPTPIFRASQNDIKCSLDESAMDLFHSARLG